MARRVHKSSFYVSPVLQIFLFLCIQRSRGEKKKKQRGVRMILLGKCLVFEQHTRPLKVGQKCGK